MVYGMHGVREASCLFMASKLAKLTAAIVSGQKEDR